MAAVPEIVIHPVPLALAVMMAGVVVTVAMCFQVALDKVLPPENLEKKLASYMLAVVAVAHYLRQATL